MNRYICASLFFGLFLNGTGFTQPAPNNYSDGKSWLCRPGRSDVCEADLTTTIILENGNLTRERWNADPNAPIETRDVASYSSATHRDRLYCPNSFAMRLTAKPIQSRMVSAILLGTTLSVPRGKDTGGSFQHVPPCSSESQTGCVITYASFRSTVPPPPNTLFGRVSDPDMVAVCTNPAALRGGSGNLNPYFSTEGRTITGTTKIRPWVSGSSIDTPWVSLPGLLTADCKTNANTTYLEITVHSGPSARRIDDID